MLLISMFQAGFVNGLLGFLFIFPIVIFSLAFHEFGHAYTAYLYGDNTAKNQGRVTLNPMKHLDLKGTILMIFIGFGYAKPVPIQPRFFTKLKEGYFAVSIAGIICNFILFFATGIVGMFVPEKFHFIPRTIMIINANLAFFNLLPIFPMDGGRILECFWNKGRDISNWLNKNNLFAIGLAIFSAFYILPILTQNITDPIISMFLK
jgi:Zn-dependent protease